MRTDRKKNIFNDDIISSTYRSPSFGSRNRSTRHEMKAYKKAAHTALLPTMAWFLQLRPGTSAGGAAHMSGILVCSPACSTATLLLARDQLKEHVDHGEFRQSNTQDAS